MAQSREIKKLTTIARYERRLRNRLADIDWELDVLQPAQEKAKALEAQGEKIVLELEEGKSVLDHVT